MSKLVQHPKSPNLASNQIPVEFVVLHYTACSLERTLEIFFDPDRKVCSHFVIAPDGGIHDLGGFFDGPILQAAHAGQSRFELAGVAWEKFNEFSVGIEIVNLNGNILDYTEAQYGALATLLSRLKSRFPKLLDPNRVVGHEHIAGFRGKADPGVRFDWVRFFKSVYGDSTQIPARPPLLSAGQVSRLADILARTSAEDRANPEFWSDLSSRVEKNSF